MPTLERALRLMKGAPRVAQVGSGAYTPRHICPPGEREHSLPNGLLVQWFEFAPGLGAYMAGAHAHAFLRGNWAQTLNAIICKAPTNCATVPSSGCLCRQYPRHVDASACVELSKEASDLGEELEEDTSG